MKVALVLFPIWGAGGLTTDVVHYRRILKAAGHTCDYWTVRYTDKDHGKQFPLELGTNQDSATVKAGYLSISNKNVGSTVKILNRYDVVMYLHPCPHITDKQQAAKNWPALYTDVTARKIVRITDVYLDKLYPWLMDYTETFEAWATNYAQLNYIRQFIPNAQLSTYPMAFKDHGIKYGKTTDVMWPCAWRGWKGIKQFVDALPDVHGSIELYGSGRELRTLRKAGNQYALQCKGAVKPGVIVNAYKRSRLSVDLTGWSSKYLGHCNRTYFEPMFFGAVLVGLPFMHAPNSQVPEYCMWTVEKRDIATSINTILNSKKIQKGIREAAYEWATEEFAHSKVVQEIEEGVG